MKRYFKIVNDNADQGWGFVYYEFTAERCTRQIYQDGESWSHYEQAERPNLNMCDQRLSVMGFYVDDEISEQEFEAAWQKSIHA